MTPAPEAFLPFHVCMCVCAHARQSQYFFPCRIKLSLTPIRSLISCSRGISLDAAEKFKSFTQAILCAFFRPPALFLPVPQGDIRCGVGVVFFSGQVLLFFFWPRKLSLSLSSLSLPSGHPICPFSAFLCPLSPLLGAVSTTTFSLSHLCSPRLKRETVQVSAFLEGRRRVTHRSKTFC